MLFFIFVIILILGVGIWYFSNYYLDDNLCLSLIGIVISSISGACIFISLIVIIAQYTTATPYVEQNKTRYETLCYKLESEEARDEFGLLNKEIIDEIQDWNEDLTYYQAVQDDFWLGIYYPNVFDQFKKIELK